MKKASRRHDVQKRRETDERRERERKGDTCFLAVDTSMDMLVKLSCRCCLRHEGHMVIGRWVYVYEGIDG